MNRKNLIFTAVLCVALAFGFSACENPNNDDLLNQIEDLKNELNDLKNDKDKTDSADKDGDKDTSSDNEQSGEGTPDPDGGEGDSSVDGIGVFSVSADKQVAFSPGNLQYIRSADTWQFASCQYEVLGTDNVTGGSVSTDATYGDSKSGTALADKIDLFGWSTNATNFGVSTSTDWKNDYLGSFVDWGSNQIGADAPNTWRTLTKDEWFYLQYYRTNANDLYGVAQVNGVNGLILLPDSWTCPDGITFKLGFHDDNGVEYYAAYQTFTAAEWSKMEVAGAVFLPAAGGRSGSAVYDVRCYGRYWSATESGSGYALYLYFYSDDSGTGGSSRDDGHSVRLVKDL